MTQEAAKKFAKITLSLPKTTTYIEMPLAFTGKDKRFEGLNYFSHFMLAEIHTTTKVFGSAVKLTYDYFVERYGCSRETISAAKKELVNRGLIEELDISRYKIIPNYDKKQRLRIDTYLLKHRFMIDGKEKRLPRSQIELLAFLEQLCTNPKTSGLFLSSQYRIGKAINMPRTTAGNGLRKLSGCGLIAATPTDNHVEAYKRGLCLYDVHPELLNVKRVKPKQPKTAKTFTDYNRYTPEYEEDEETKFKREHAILLTELEHDETYIKLREELKEHNDRFISACVSRDMRLISEGEAQTQKLEEKLCEVLKVHGVSPNIFPQGFFYIR